MSNKKLNPFKKEEFILLLWNPGPPQSKGLCLAIHSLVKYCVPLRIYMQTSGDTWLRVKCLFC